MCVCVCVGGGGGGGGGWVGGWGTGGGKEGKKGNFVLQYPLLQIPADFHSCVRSKCTGIYM